MGGICSTHRIIEKSQRFSVVRSEGKRLLARSTCRWRYNMKTILKELAFQVVSWIHLVQDKIQWRTLVNMVMDPWVP